MKKSIIILSFCLVAVNLFSQVKDYSLAKVGDKINGVYIFVMCEPAQEYKYLGTVEVKINWTGTKAENFEKVIKKAKKDYPYFNGMVFQKKDMSKADLIQFTGLEISKGGVNLGQRVTYIDKKVLVEGEVVELKDKKAAIQLDNGKIVQLEYKRLTPVNQ